MKNYYFYSKSDSKREPISYIKVDSKEEAIQFFSKLKGLSLWGGFQLTINN